MNVVEENYRDEYGLLNIPAILQAGLSAELFPEVMNIEAMRRTDFPLLTASGRVYLDSAATTQTPHSVLTRMFDYRTTHLRGSNHAKNSLEAVRAQKNMDVVRKKLQDFFSAQQYIISFTGGATDAANFIAARFPFAPGDLLLLTESEHNSQVITASNFAKAAGAKIAYVNVTLPDGRLDLAHLDAVLRAHQGGKILLNLVHVSNVTGVCHAVREVRERLGERGYVYLDMAQSAGHLHIDLDQLDVDFAGVSAHKMFGPMGIGALFIHRRCATVLSRVYSGGSAVKLLSKWRTAVADAPECYEPGTQDIEGAIEWGFVIDYLLQQDRCALQAHEQALAQYFLQELCRIPNVQVYGPTDMIDRIGVFTFNIGAMRKKNYDKVAKMLDEQGIAVRDGCFCAHVYTARLMGMSDLSLDLRTWGMAHGVDDASVKLPGAVRVSFAFYNALLDAYRALQAINRLAIQ